jgi:hypothetical protein
MPSRTFLSVDMDFFNLDTGTGRAREFLDRVLELGVPTKAVMNHQQMLPMVNGSGADYLLNVDEHSDLFSFRTRNLNCGSWVTFVRWADVGTYHWWGRSADGDCTGGSFPIFVRSGVNRKPEARREWAWRELKASYEDRLPRLRDYGIVEACVCLSPSYSSSEVMDVFRKWVRDNRVPYSKGAINEDMKWAFRTPPVRKGEEE